eukprot:1234008-Rhodomonas_salina.2
MSALTRHARHQQVRVEIQDLTTLGGPRMAPLAYLQLDSVVELRQDNSSSLSRLAQELVLLLGLVGIVEGQGRLLI